VVPVLSRQHPQGASATTITKEDEVELPQTRGTVLKAPEMVALAPLQLQ
jgi:hypothetical protein